MSREKEVGFGSGGEGRAVMAEGWVLRAVKGVLEKCHRRWAGKQRVAKKRGAQLTPPFSFVSKPSRSLPERDKILAVRRHRVGGLRQNFRYPGSFPSVPRHRGGRPGRRVTCATRTEWCCCSQLLLDTTDQPFTKQQQAAPDLRKALTRRSTPNSRCSIDKPRVCNSRGFRLHLTYPLPFHPRTVTPSPRSPRPPLRLPVVLSTTRGRPAWCSQQETRCSSKTPCKQQW